jgi:carbon storage regulator CsrA
LIKTLNHLLDLPIKRIVKQKNLWRRLTVLIVGREIGQSVIIGDEIKVTVIQKDSKLRLVIDSPTFFQIKKLKKSFYTSSTKKKQTQKIGETVVIGDQVKVTILQTESGLLRFAIDAPKEISVYREEIYENRLINQTKIKKMESFNLYESPYSFN